MHLLSRLLLAAAFCSAFTCSGLAASDADSTNTEIVIPRLPAPPKLENFLTMQPEGATAQQMTKVENFIQRKPSDGQPASQHTEVYLGYDDNNLHAVFVAFDREPDKVRASMVRRENVFNDDIVEIMLDTFHDQRRAYAFVANPLGIQWDALWTEGQDFDESWDTLWHSEGKRTPQGYVVLMAIPFRSLRFPPVAEQNWGLILVRDIRRGREESSFWPRVSNRVEGRLNQAATLTGLRDISAGRNMQFIPYATYRSFKVLDFNEPEFVEDNFDPDLGLDAKLVIKDRFALDLTANPDFNQVESDDPQVTVNQRFEVFFPEKRPFFLENANYFQTPINLVFTRRIGEPAFGSRLTGKTGPYAVGALIADDEGPGKSVASGSSLAGDRAYFAIGRVSRDILNQSDVGVTYTDREFGDSYNRVASVDSRIKLNQNWIASVQGVASWSQAQTGGRFAGTALDLQLNRDGRQLNTHSHYRQFSPDFLTRSGFVSRVDVRDLHNFIDYKFRPEGKFLISWGPELFNQEIWDFAGTRLDAIWSPQIEFDFTGDTELRFGYDNIDERLRAADAPGLLANRNYAQDQWEVGLESNYFDAVNFDAELGWGEEINFLVGANRAPELADFVRGDFELALKPMTSLRIENNYIITRLQDKVSSERIFTNHLLRSRWNWQLNRELSLRFIFDYDALLLDEQTTERQSSKRFNIDFLLTYLVNPWTALYVGVNRSYQNIAVDGHEIVNTGNDFTNDARQVFVKYSYLFRF